MTRPSKKPEAPGKGAPEKPKIKIEDLGGVGLLDQDPSSDPSYKAAIELLSKIGMKEEEAIGILSDESNPYIDDLLEFVDSMERNKTKLIGTNKKGEPVFQDSGDETKYSMAKLNRAIRWMKDIFPELLNEAHMQGFSPELIEKVTFTHLPAMEYFLTNPKEFGADSQMRNELRNVRKMLKSGMKMDQIKVELEREIPLPAEQEKADEKEREERSEFTYKAMQIRDFKDEAAALNSLLLDNLIKGSKSVNLENLGDTMGKVEEQFDNLAQKAPKIEPLIGNAKQALLDIEAVVAEAKSRGDSPEQTRATIEELTGGMVLQYDELQEKAIEERDGKSWAAGNLFGASFGDIIGMIVTAYGINNE